MLAERNWRSVGRCQSEEGHDKRQPPVGAQPAGVDTLPEALAILVNESERVAKHVVMPVDATSDNEPTPGRDAFPERLRDRLRNLLNPDRWLIVKWIDHHPVLRPALAQHSESLDVIRFVPRREVLRDQFAEGLQGRAATLTLPTLMGRPSPRHWPRSMRLRKPSPDPRRCFVTTRPLAGTRHSC